MRTFSRKASLLFQFCLPSHCSQLSKVRICTSGSYILSKGLSPPKICKLFPFVKLMERKKHSSVQIHYPSFNPPKVYFIQALIGKMVRHCGWHWRLSPINRLIERYILDRFFWFFSWRKLRSPICPQSFSEIAVCWHFNSNHYCQVGK